MTATLARQGHSHEVQTSIHPSSGCKCKCPWAGTEDFILDEEEDDDDDIDEDQQDVGYSAELEQIKANFSMMMSGTEMEKEEKKEVLPEVTVDSQEKNKSKFRAPMPTKKS